MATDSPSHDCGLDNASATPRHATPASPAILVVAGLGIQWAGQTTLAAKRAIERADLVLFAVSNPRAAQWIRELKPTAESFTYPRDGRPRREIYSAMVERILLGLREGQNVCAVFYGSPAVFTMPAHDAIRRASREGFRTRMLPGVSSLDCLFADLGVDPGELGCQIHEAGDFLRERRAIDPRSPLVLCQPALIGNRRTFDETDSKRIREGLGLLGRRLGELYPRNHEAIIYEAAENPLQQSRAEPVSLSALRDATISEISTLYVPPRVDGFISEITSHRGSESSSPDVHKQTVVVRTMEEVPMPDDEKSPKPLLAQVMDAEEALGKLLSPQKVGTQLPPPPDETLGGAFATRGSLRLKLGFAEGALEDLLRGSLGDRTLADAPLDKLLPVYDKAGKLVQSGRINALLGEALRVYARDVVLKVPNRAGELKEIIRRSLEAFKRAAEGLKGDKSKFAWVLAHMAAMDTMRYWILKSLGGEPKDEEPKETRDAFNDAERTFKESQRIYEEANGKGKIYEWSTRFLAFLYAIRGSMDDFRNAIRQLRTIRSPDSMTQSSVKRALVMLYSYIAGSPEVSREERQAAGLEGIRNGAEAIAIDAEDPIAAYFTASTLYSLAANTEDSGERAQLMAMVVPAVKSARLRAMDIVSQSYVALAGLDVISALTAGNDQDAQKAADRARSILARFGEKPGTDFGSISPDLETRAIFSRDPTFQLIRNQKLGAAVDPKRHKVIYDTFSREPNVFFDALVQKFAVR